MKYDFAIIGSGIIGLTLAYKLKQKFDSITDKDINHLELLEIIDD